MLLITLKSLQMEVSLMLPLLCILKQQLWTAIYG